MPKKLTGKPNGRPPIFENAEQMQVLIDEYYAEKLLDEKPLTITGLAYTLGMDRRSLINYGLKDEFFPTVSRAKAKVELSIEEGLMRGYNATGCIFNLKNNFGWKDQTEQKISSESTHHIVELMPARTDVDKA